MANLKDLENHLETIYHAKENGGIVDVNREAVFILGMCNEIRLEILKEVGGADLERDGSLPIDGVSNLLIAFGNELQKIGLTPYDDVESIVKTYVSDL